MDRHLWTRIAETFDKALDCPASERDLFLQRECGSDDSLRKEVARLLAEFDQAGDFLSPLTTLPPSLVVGERIAGRYRIEALLGRGGMGEVYRAHDHFINEHVALKTLRPELAGSPEVVRQFQRELQLARRVTHPNVCRVFDIGIHEDGGSKVHFFTMQFLNGENLSEQIRRRGTIPIEEANNLAVQMAEGLHAAHQADIIHRDFKSANVILQDGAAVITDFGLARLGPSKGAEDVRSTITGKGSVAGTIAYMSPEQLMGGKLTPASDIYSLGIVLFEMSTGRLPFDAEDIIHSAMQRALDAAPDVHALAPTIDPNWAAVISRCLQLEPERRYGAAAEVADQLRKRSWLHQKLAWNRRQWTKAAVASAISVGGVALLSTVYRFNSQDIKVPEGARALLGSITNSTGELNLSAVTELLRNQLSQSVHLSLIDEAELSGALKQMGKPEDTTEPEVVREAAWRLNAAVSVFGNVSRIGPDYALSVQVETRGAQPDNPRNKSLKTFSASNPAQLMHSVREASLWVRETIGESAASIASFDRLPENATTPSWEALAYYARGQRFFMKQDYEAAILEFDHALQRDPGFTLAALRRADLLTSQDRQTEAFAQWKEAMSLLKVRTVTRAEELNARAMFAYDTGDYQEADRQFKTWALEYPRDWHGSFYRVVPLILNGHAGQALELLQNLRQSLPNYGDLYAQMISCLLVLGRTDEARALVPELRKYNRAERADLRDAYCYFREGDCVRYLEVLRKVQQSKSYRRMAADAMAREAALLFDCGLPEAAAARVEAFLKAGSWAEAVPQEITLLMLQAWGESLSRRHAEAVTHSRRVLETERGPVLTFLAGSVFARAKRPDLVKLALDVCSENGAYPAYRLARHRLLGAAADAEGRRNDAIREFQSAAALEPKIAHRQYLIEALPHADPARLELCLNVVRIPWQVFRPPPFHNLGSLHSAVPAVNAEPTLREPFAVKFAESSATISRMI